MKSGFEGHTHTNVVTRGEALNRAQAANELGGIVVSALKDEGEHYVHGSYSGVVPEGRVQIRVSSGKDLSEFGKRARQLDEESGQRQAA